MIPISHMPSPRSLLNSFHHCFNLFNSSFRSAQQFLWHFSSSFSTFGDRRSVSLKSWPFSWRFVVLASCHPHYCSDYEESFSYPPKAFHEFFPLWSSEGHHFRIFLRSQFSTSSSNYSSLMSLRSSPYFTVVLSRLTFRCYHFNSFVLFTILPVVRWRFTQVYARSLFNSNENK